LDNLTHSLFGVTLARTPLGRAGRGTTAALILASNAPDIDIVTTAGGAVKYLEWHRGMTHGPLGIVGLGVVTAVLVWIGRRFYDERWGKPNAGAGSGATDSQDAPLGMLIAVSIVGVLLHVLMDLPTSYGTRLLSPFDWHWFAMDWMPIIDIYLLMALVIGLLGRSTPQQRRAKAAFVLLVMATNYGVRAAAHRQALEVAPRLFGPTLPAPCDPRDESTGIVDSWPRPAAPSDPPSGKRCLVEIVAMPSFTSPFAWRIIAQMSNAYEIHDIDLLDRRYRERFREYSDALDISSSLQSLGALAWRRISGGDRPSERMTMLLAIRVRAELAGLVASGRALVTGASDERRSSTATPVREAPSSG
jgi:membrane-bound metal-dependent hydrolase YbcI (DUF457 family)